MAWMVGIGHQFLSEAVRPYRKLGARSFERRDSVDRAFQILDLMARMATGDERRQAGTAKSFERLALRPTMRVHDAGRRLHRASFGNATLYRVKFDAVHLDRTHWRGASLRACTFNSCRIRHAAFAPASARGTNFTECVIEDSTLDGNLDRTTFVRCTLRSRDEMPGSFVESRFHDCSLSSVDLSGADLRGAIFERCDLSNAILRGALLQGATFVDCDLRGANLSEADIAEMTVTGSQIYGISLWSTKGEVALAQNLSLAKEGEVDALEIDGLHIASFVSSLIEGNGVRDLVDGLTSSMVLILGRFSPPHKGVLNGIRDGLRQLGYGAVVFDSSLPSSRDATETIAILARLSRFVVADLTDPRSVPHEVNQFVADCATPLQVVTRSEEPFSMFEDLEKYPWVMPPRRFADGDDLLARLPVLLSGLEQRRGALRS